MNVIPAVDLKQGNCVRLLQGDPDRETIYGEHPLEVARHWESKGAKRLHLVDLDGAFNQDSENQTIIKDIVNKLGIPCQVGGGIRSEQAIESLLEAGADSCVIGTAGIRDPEWLQKTLETFGERRIIGGVDCRGGKVMIEGWKESSAYDLVEWIKILEEIGVRTIIYTDVERDGSEVGPDYDGIRTILKHSGLNVIASGGIGTLSDLTQFKELQTERLPGVIVGRALYEENFNFTSAVEALSTSPVPGKSD